MMSLRKTHVKYVRMMFTWFLAVIYYIYDISTPVCYICFATCLIGNFWRSIAVIFLVLRFETIVSFCVVFYWWYFYVILMFCFVTRYVFLNIDLFLNFSCKESAIFNCWSAIIGLRSLINFCVLNSWSAIIDDFLCFKFLKGDHRQVLVF